MLLSPGNLIFHDSFPFSDGGMLDEWSLRLVIREHGQNNIKLERRRVVLLAIQSEHHVTDIMSYNTALCT
jgi:hypothetical protein